jgi:hypothetical protein
MYSLSPQSAVAKPTINTSDNVSFTGTVSISKPPAVGTVYVNLTAIVPKNWTVNIAPASMKFITGGSLSYIVKVMVPARTITGDYIVGVTGTATCPSSGTDSYNQTTIGKVSVPQYYLLYMNYSEVQHTTSSKSFEIGITNEGNGVTNVSINIENSSRLEQYGVQFIIDKPYIEIEPGQTANVIVRIDYDKETLSKNIDYISVKATFVSSGKNHISYANKTRINLNLQPDRLYDSLPLSVLLVILAVSAVVLLFRGTRRHENRKK